MKAIVLAIVASSLVGCIHTWKAGGEFAPEPEAVNEDKYPDGVEFTGYKNARNEFEVKNTSQEIIYISYKDSAVIADGKSYRVIPGQQRVIHDDAVPADSPVAPGTTANLNLFSNALYQHGMNVAERLEFRIAVRRQSGKVDFAVLVSKREVGRQKTFTTGERHWPSCGDPTPEERALADAEVKRIYGPKAEAVFVGCKPFHGPWPLTAH